MNPADAVGVANDLFGTGLSLGSGFAKALPTHRQCTVCISNESSKYTLSNPRVHTERGRCAVPFPPCIKPSATGEALFKKVANQASGSVGLFTFDLLNNSTSEPTERMAIMYKVPFDQNTKANQYAVGVFDISRECNRDLFHEMSKSTSSRFVCGKAKGPSLTHRSQNITIMATMSDCHTPMMKVYVSDTEPTTAE